MTEPAETAVRLDEELASELGHWIASAKEKAEGENRRAGPDGKWWTEDLLGELVHNGILRCAGDVYEFMHPSIRDYFCASVWIGKPLGEVLSNVPEARWKTGELAAVNEQQSRYYQTLVLLSGLRDDTGELVLALIAKDPLLAAECYGSRNQEYPEAEAALTYELLRGLGSESRDERRRAITECRLARLHRGVDIADALLQVSLSPSEGADSANAVLQLGQFSRQDSFARLLNAMLNSADSMARCTAAMLLPERGDRVLERAMLHCVLGSAQALMGVEPAMAHAAHRLIEKETSFDALMQTALTGSEDAAASALLVLRLTDAEKASRRCAEIANDSDRAIVLLPLLGDPALAPLLLLLTNEQLADDVRAGAAKGLALLKAQGWRLPGVDRSDRVGPILRQHAANTACPPTVRSGLIAALMQTADDADLDFALQLLADGSLVSTVVAASTAGIWRDVEVSVPSWLNSSFQVVAERHIYGGVPKERMLKILRWLRELQSTKDDPVRDAAYQAHLLAPGSARKMLLHILLDPAESGSARREAALLSVPFPNVLMRAVIDLDEDDLRSFCADALIIVHQQLTIDWATKELLGPGQEPKVRERAAAALMSPRSRSAINAVIEVIRSSDDKTAVGAAIYALMRFLARNSPDPETITRSRVYTMAGDYDVALRDYDEAIAANPADFDLALGRAHLYCLRKELDRALDEVDRIAGAVPDRADVLSLRAHVVSLMGRTDEAVAEYERALADRSEIGYDAGRVDSNSKGSRTGGGSDGTDRAHASGDPRRRTLQPSLL